MFAIKRTLKYMSGAFAVVALIAACAKSDNSRVGRVSGNGVGVAANTPSCPSTSAAYVSENGGYTSGNFQTIVDGLLSATVDPQYFGTITSSNGVQVQGRLAFDNSGNLNAPASNLQLTITDSFVGQTDNTGATVQPYLIQFNSASSGQINVSNGTFVVQFKDNFGEVDLNGQFNTSTVMATVSYVNYANVVAGSSNAQGTIGVFQMPRCGFIY